jgi:hypothetical protein
MTTKAAPIIHALYNVSIKSKSGSVFMPPDIVRCIAEQVLCENRDALQQKQIRERELELSNSLSWDSWRCSPKYRSDTRNKINNVLEWRHQISLILVRDNSDALPVDISNATHALFFEGW